MAVSMAISAQYLTGEYEAKNPTFHVEDSAWKAGQILKVIARQGAKPASIAEVGCGAGEILVQLARQMPRALFTGYELSPQGFSLCQERASDRIEYLREDMLDAEEVYDLALCIDVFEHVEDYFTFLRQLRGRARAFVFHIPLDMNMQMVARPQRMLWVRGQVGHLHYFSKDTALATLRDCGYEVRDWFYTPNGADRPKTGRAKMLQLPRKILSGISQDLTARVLGGYSLMVWAE